MLRCPPQLLEQVAVGLQARELCLLSLASPQLQWLLDEPRSQELWLEEVRRLDLEREWSAEESPVADGQSEMSKPAPSHQRLRQFLVSHSLQKEAEEQLRTAERYCQACADFLRFVILGVCWCSFFCQVVRLAVTESPHTPTVIVKAMVSPFLFIYILEKGTENLRRSFLVGLLAVALLWDSIRRSG